MLKAVKRGSTSVVTIPEKDLGAGGTSLLEIEMAQDVELPKKITVRYPSTKRDHQPAAQYAMRTATTSNNEVVIELPVVLSDDRAAQLADILLKNAWTERVKVSFSTTKKYAFLQPCDIVTIAGASYTHVVRIISKEQNGGQINWVASSEDNAAYSSSVVGGDTSTPPFVDKPDIGVAGVTVAEWLDLPPLNDTQFALTLWAACRGTSAGWKGCVIQKSVDNGYSWTDVGTCVVEATSGEVSESLPAWSGGNIVDNISTCVVVTNKPLYSVSYDLFLNGTNAAMIEGEVVYFKNATQIGANTYRLSTLIRKVKDTTVNPKYTGKFLLLNTALIPVTLSLSEYKKPIKLRAVTIGQASNTGNTYTVQVNDGGIVTLAPVFAKAYYDGVNVIAEWVRQAKQNTQWLNGIDVPLDETFEKYQVNWCRLGGTVYQTSQVSVPSCSLTGTPQVGDYLSISQINDEGFAGAATTVNIQGI